jgi:HK97 family phage prohead protease
MASWRKLRIPTAKAVVRRGFGAYSGSHRPGVSRQAWGLARLKAFSYLLRNDRPKNTKYVGDNDLLPESHPRFSKVEKKSDVFYDIKGDAMSLTSNILNNKVRINNVNKEKENRSFNLANVEIRENNEGEFTYSFSGYASVFDKPYGVRDSKGTYTETIKPGAFKKTLQEQDDVRFLINHDGIPLARSSSGTLKLEEDEYGLFVQADLDPNNPKVAEVASAMKRGDLNEMSFAFAAIRDDFSGEKRDVQEVRLFDVSVVTYPANSYAGATLRGLDISENLKELVESRNTDQAVKVLEQIIEELDKPSAEDERSKSNPKLEVLKIKMKKDGLL